MVSAARWVRGRLFATPLDSVITIALVSLVLWCTPAVLRWVALNAVWGSQPASACDAVRGHGACWAVVWAKLRFMVFAMYPVEEQWRAALAIGLQSAVIAVAAWPRLRTGRGALIASGLTAASVWLLAGGLGLSLVSSEQWGGLAVTLLLAIVGMAFAFPVGVALALARRSAWPLLRAFATVYIETLRGVPLITVLFTASVLFALFVPEDMRISQLLRAQIAIVLFVAAYLAEAVRGGLQTVERGQFLAAQALGLSDAQAMRDVILPQALRHAVPAIVNSFISLIKDTSLVVIISIFDFAYAVKKAVETDAQWKPYFVEAFLFSIAVYWVYCFAVSRIGLSVERHLSRADASGP